jgi:hypothetical protein
VIFQATWEAVLEGRKTETRRICKPGEVDDRTLCCDAAEWPDLHVRIPERISTVYTGTEYGRLTPKWRRNHTYAIQPGRGQKSVGRIRLLDIRQERLQDITEAGAIAEGCKGFCFHGVGMGEVYEDSMTPIQEYESVWNTIHTRKGERWDDNPAVWVLRFELVEDTK